MSDDDRKFQFKVGDDVTEMTLADIADFDMDGVEEYRGGGVWPAGKFTFEVMGFELTTAGEGENEKPLLQNTLKCVGVTSVVDSTINGDDLIDKENWNNFFMNDPEKGLGNQKAFWADIGLKASGKLHELGDASCGLKFDCEVYHVADKNDKERKYQRFRGITPHVG